MNDKRVDKVPVKKLELTEIKLTATLSLHSLDLQGLIFTQSSSFTVLIGHREQLDNKVQGEKLQETGIVQTNTSFHVISVARQATMLIIKAQVTAKSLIK